MSFRSHRLGHVLRRLPRVDHRHHHPGSRRHRHPGRVYDFGLGNRHHHRGADCHRHTGCSAASDHPTAIAAVRHRGAGFDHPGIRHHHHRSEATVGVAAGAGAKAVVVSHRRLDSLGWASRRTGSIATVTG